MGEPLTARTKALIRQGLSGCEPMLPVPATAMLSEIVAQLTCALTATDPATYVRTAHDMAALLLQQAQRNAQ